MTEKFWQIIKDRAANRGYDSLSKLGKLMDFNRGYLYRFHSGGNRSSLGLYEMNRIKTYGKPRVAWFGALLYFLDITPEEIVEEDSRYTIDSATELLKSSEELGKKLKMKACTIDSMSEVKEVDVVRGKSSTESSSVFYNRKLNRKDLEYLRYLIKGPIDIFIHDIPQILLLLRK
jgi:hypothetical protein